MYVLVNSFGGFNVILYYNILVYHFVIVLFKFLFLPRCQSCFEVLPQNYEVFSITLNCAQYFCCKIALFLGNCQFSFELDFANTKILMGPITTFEILLVYLVADFHKPARLKCNLLSYSFLSRPFAVYEI